MPAVGIDPRTGKSLIGFDRCVFSIGRILSTEIGSRVQRRDFGSLIPRLIDKPQNPETVIEFYMAIAEALEPRRVRNAWYGEPCFGLKRCLLDGATPGQITLLLTGDYYPSGHLGDFSNPDPREITYPVNRLSESFELAAEEG